MEKKKVNIPKKGASRKLAERLEEMGKRKPPKSLVDKLNRGSATEKKIASPSSRRSEPDLEL